MTNGEPGQPARSQAIDDQVPNSPGTGATTRRRMDWVVIADGQRLGALRRQRELSRQMLAERAGLSPATVARLESRTQASCRGRTLARLAAALGTRPADMLPPAAITLAAAGRRTSSTGTGRP